MASKFDEGSADIPIWGWLTGANARVDAERNAYDQRRQEAMWEGLGDVAPGAEDLAVEYGQIGTTDEYGDLLGPGSQLEGFAASSDQESALRALQELSRGGLTDADRAMMRGGHQRTAQTLAAQNAAATGAMQARGMGGSGAQLAAQMSNAQGMAQANAGADAQMMGNAQQRALQALQGYTNQGNAMQAQEMARRSALDRFNSQQTDWRRQRAGQNTQWGNRTAESAADARQSAYQNRERAVAGATGQYQAGQDNRRQDAAREDQANATAAAGLGGLIAEIAS